MADSVRPVSGTPITKEGYEAWMKERWIDSTNKVQTGNLIKPVLGIVNTSGKITPAATDENKHNDTIDIDIKYQKFYTKDNPGGVGIAKTIVGDPVTGTQINNYLNNLSIDNILPSNWFSFTTADTLKQNKGYTSSPGDFQQVDGTTIQNDAPTHGGIPVGKEIKGSIRCNYTPGSPGIGGGFYIGKLPLKRNEGLITSYTISFWMKSNGNTDPSCIFSSTDSNPNPSLVGDDVNGYRLFTYNTAQPLDHVVNDKQWEDDYYMGGVEDVSVKLLNTGPITAGEWKHIAITIKDMEEYLEHTWNTDPARTYEYTHEMKLYVNGVYTDTSYGIPSAPFYSLIFGMRKCRWHWAFNEFTDYNQIIRYNMHTGLQQASPVSDLFWNGAIAEPMFIPGALSDADITKIYNNTLIDDHVNIHVDSILLDTNVVIPQHVESLSIICQDTIDFNGYKIDGSGEDGIDGPAISGQPDAPNGVHGNTRASLGLYHGSGGIGHSKNEAVHGDGVRGEGATSSNIMSATISRMWGSGGAGDHTYMRAILVGYKFWLWACRFTVVKSKWNCGKWNAKWFEYWVWLFRTDYRRSSYRDGPRSGSSGANAVLVNGSIDGVDTRAYNEQRGKEGVYGTKGENARDRSNSSVGNFGYFDRVIPHIRSKGERGQSGWYAADGLDGGGGGGGGGTYKDRGTWGGGGGTGGYAGTGGWGGSGANGGCNLYIEATEIRDANIDLSPGQGGAGGPGQIGGQPGIGGAGQSNGDISGGTGGTGLKGGDGEDGAPGGNGGFGLLIIFYHQKQGDISAISSPTGTVISQYT